MIRKIDNISRRIESEIQLRELDISDIIRDVPHIIQILEKGFLEVKQLVSKNKFNTYYEEITFFKEIKPRLFSKLIYYKKIHNLELNKPVCGYEAIKEYFEREQEYINLFHHKNNDFIQYYRLGKTILDEYYFLRNRHEPGLNLESFYFERDPDFSTNYDFKAAKLLANDMLATYLKSELIKLKQSEDTINGALSVNGKYRWTDTKSALVELIYAIHAEQSVNSGNIDLKILSSIFEQMFNIELGDIYRIFVEIRGRKGERTTYLNRLILALNKRMNNADNK
ncbi:RteC domain-containing protein [Parabacteroides sp. Marseille-P3160]|uniref:RteC domain-containing protein n=1 Tax=Parabacteroides sp. Marseille-P3160 TaxID=1917887 RepID=UPI0009BAAF1A|nr:RteC domain-containing protein [Parabacteroides sp. Marseille-P3160]